MALSDRFYIWRAACWGGGHVFEIWERAGFKKRRVKSWKTEKAAQKDCQIRNDHWQRYQAARWNEAGRP